MTREPQAIQEILSGLKIVSDEMRETRGRKKKYFFYHLQKGEHFKKIVPLSKGRTIQTAMKNAANRDGIKIMIQNHGTYLLIKRIK